MKTLKQQTVSGIKWQVTTSFLRKAIQIAGTVILARILEPADFGLFALTFIIIEAFGLFQSMGFDSALIQRRENLKEASNSAFVLIPLLGIIFYIILFFSAPLIGIFLHDRQIDAILKTLGIIFVLSCFGRVPAVIMERNMQFRTISVIDIVIAVIYSSSAVIFAFLKMGVWSLVYAYILRTLIQNVMFFILSGWRPSFSFDKKVFFEMFHFGKFLILSSLVWFLKMNLDNILVGKLLGTTILGFYAIAFNIANFGSDYFGSKVYKVIFPTFSKLQTNTYDLKIAFLKTTRFIGIFAFPFCAGLLLFADVLIQLLYGTKWLAAIPVLKILAFAGLFNTLATAMGPLFIATGNSKIGFYFSLLQVVLFFTLIMPAANFYGLLGVGTVVVLSQICAIALFLPRTMSLISIKIKDIFRVLKPGLFASIIMFFAVLLAQRILLILRIASLPSFNFLILLAVAIIFYVGFLFKFEKQILVEIKNIIFSI